MAGENTSRTPAATTDPGTSQREVPGDGNVPDSTTARWKVEGNAPLSEKEA